MALSKPHPVKWDRTMGQMALACYKLLKVTWVGKGSKWQHLIDKPHSRTQRCI